MEARTEGESDITLAMTPRVSSSGMIVNVADDRGVVSRSWS